MNQLEKLRNRIKELDLNDEHFAVAFINRLFEELDKAGGDYEIFVVVPPEEPDPNDVLVRDYGIKFKVTAYTNEQQLTDFWYGKDGAYVSDEHIEEYHKNKCADINLIWNFSPKTEATKTINQIVRLYKKIKENKI